MYYFSSNLAKTYFIYDLARGTHNADAACIDNIGVILFDYGIIERRILDYYEPMKIINPPIIEGRIGFDPGAVNNRHNRRAAERKNKKK